MEEERISIDDEIFQKLYNGISLSEEEKRLLKQFLEQEKKYTGDRIDDEDKIIIAKAMAEFGDREYLKATLKENEWGFDSWDKYIAIKTFIDSIELPNEDMTGFLLQDCIFGDQLGLKPREKIRCIQEVKQVGEWPERNYFQFIDTCLKDKNMHFDSFCISELIHSLDGLSVMQEKRDMGDGFQLTMYERYLYAAMNELPIENDHKVYLISQTQDWNFIAPCLVQMQLTPREKQRLIVSMQNFDGITKEEYLSHVLECIQNSKEIGLTKEQCFELALHANTFQGQEEQQKEKEEGQLSPYSEFISRAILMKQDEWDPEMVECLIRETKDIDLIEAAVFSKTFPLNMDQKVGLIASTENQDFIDKVLKGDLIEKLGFRAKSSLVTEMAIFYVEEEKRNDFIKSYLENEEYDFPDEDKLYLLRLTHDVEYMKEALERFDWASEREKVELVTQTEDIEFIKHYLEEHQNQLNTNYQDKLICATKEEERISVWESRIHRMDSIAGMSEEELEKLPDDAMIQFQGEDLNGLQKTLYSKQDMITIRSKMDKLLQGIPSAEKGNTQSELDTFLAVYQRLMPIPYDTYAISTEGERDKELQRRCRNLECLLSDEPTCVCAGYAEILRNALALKGIECKVISGLTEKSDEAGHAWNQVKIGGNWYNVDLTWDRDKCLELGGVGPEVLKTDQEFEDHKEYSLGRRKSESRCETSINDALCRSAQCAPARSIEDVSNEAEKLQVGVQELAKKNGITYTEVVSEARTVQKVERQTEMEIAENQVTYGEME